MSPVLIRRVLLLLAIAAPAVVLRVTATHPNPVVGLFIFGASVVAASFLLAWAAEAAQKDISGALAVAILALIAVLPEYAVDLYFAYRSGSDPSFEQYAAANMTGSNRLLLGFGWPLVVLLALVVARRRARAHKRDANLVPWYLDLPGSTRLDIGILGIVALLAFFIPALATIHLYFGLGLIAIFGYYLWRTSRVPDSGDEEFVGMAGHIASLPGRIRKPMVISMFVVSAAIILSSAEPFANSLIGSGSKLGIDSFFLVQWLAPLASEAPEFIIAALFAMRGMGSAAIGTLIASKINQWTLLVGSLPIAHLAGGGGTSMPLDGRQVEEFVLTASQTIMGVAILISLRFHRWSAISLAGLFALQFVIPTTEGRYVLSGIHILVAAIVLIVNRRHIIPTIVAPFRDTPTEPESRLLPGTKAASSTSRARTLDPR